MCILLSQKDKKLNFSFVVRRIAFWKKWIKKMRFTNYQFCNLSCTFSSQTNERFLITPVHHSSSWKFVTMYCNYIWDIKMKCHSHSGYSALVSSFNISSIPRRIHKRPESNRMTWLHITESKNGGLISFLNIDGTYFQT